MDGGERGGSSSSPSAKTISKITRGAGGRIEVRFSDGSSFFSPADAIEVLEIEVGMTFDEERFAALTTTMEKAGAASRALSLLAGREHSRFQLKRKLEQRGFSPAAISTALDELERSGALDDSRYAKAWVESRLRRHPEGSAMLLKRLRENGVDGAVSRDAVDEVLRESGDELLIDQAARQIMRRKGMTREKLMRALNARGFPASQIFRTADSWFGRRNME